MTKLILHVGPAKCGSSTLQDFFSTHIDRFEENISYMMLDPTLIKKLNVPVAINSDVNLLNNYVVDTDILILSHEFLFQNPNAIKNICDFFLKITDEIIIIGYSRRQSDFLVSAYSQWLFRSEDRVKEIDRVLEEFGIEKSLFNGLEKQLIASIYDDFYSARQLSEYSMMDWHTSYNNFEKLLLSKNIYIEVGILPNKKFKFDLIEDFCNKTKIKQPYSDKDKTINKANKSFNSNLIESINCAKVYGLDTIGPHEANEALHNISLILKNENILSEFLKDLLNYIDSYFLRQNIKFCDKYTLDKEYFKADTEVDKLKILQRIKNEEIYRRNNPLEIVNHYKCLTAHLGKLCLELQIKLDKG